MNKESKLIINIQLNIERDYNLILFDNSNKKISEIDLKNDDNFDSINEVNEFILTNITKYEELEFKTDFQKECNDGIIKKIINYLVETWKDEFKNIKSQIKEFIEYRSKIK